MVGEVAIGCGICSISCACSLPDAIGYDGICGDSTTVSELTASLASRRSDGGGEIVRSRSRVGDVVA